MTNTKACYGHLSQSQSPTLRRHPIKSWFRQWRMILDFVRVMTIQGRMAEIAE
jgi:hypothetical protein